MRLDLTSFWLQKNGCEPRQYEDAFAPVSAGDRPRRRLRCAVADGATEAAFSRVWARLLATAFAGGHLTAPELAELPNLERRWLHSVERSIAQRSAAAWYLEPKFDEGAFATLIGVEFAELPHRDDVGVYHAIAVGDSCLMHVRDDQARYAFPIVHSTAFTSQPSLLPSRPAAGGSSVSAMKQHMGLWRSGDVFYLMSDALACWFLGEVERGQRPWHEIDRATGAGRESFGDWVRTLRTGSLKDDDVTVLRIRFH